MQYYAAVLVALAATAAAVPGAPNVVSQISDGQPQAPTGAASYSAAPAPVDTTCTEATAPAATQGESTVWSTHEVTVTSCAASVTNCPARSTAVYTTSYPVAPSTPAAASTYPAQSPAPAGASTYPAQSPAPAGASTYPAASPAPATSAAPQVSVATISTCVPTVIYSTVTVPAAASGAAGSAPYPTGPAPAGGAPGASGAPGAASGTGAAPYPTSSPITPATGAASSFGSSMMGVAAAVAAAFILA